MEALTPRQEKALRFVRDFLRRRGYAPSVREVAAALRIGTPKGAADHLKALERKGYLVRDARRSRALRVVDAAGGPRGIPLVGRVAAGSPILAEENVEERLDVAPETFGRGGELFALRVRGDSMTGDHIRDGDLAVIRAQPSVESGEIAAVLVEGEATLKRVRRRDGRVELRPSNPAHKPIVLVGGEARVLGRLVGILRR
jgi:repressor LexA